MGRVTLKLQQAVCNILTQILEHRDSSLQDAVGK